MPLTSDITSDGTKTKADFPLFFNRRKVNPFDSNSPIQFVSGERPKYKRHIDGYIGTTGEWSRNLTKNFYDFFDGWKNVPNVKLDSKIPKSYYDSENNLFVTKSHNSLELNRAIQDYVEKKSGITFDEYQQLPNKKANITKTREEIFIDQLKTAQKYSNLAKENKYNASVIKRNIESIENSNWVGEAREKELK